MTNVTSVVVDLCDKTAELKFDDFESLMEVDNDELIDRETPMEVDDESTSIETPMEVDDDDITGTVANRVESPMEVNVVNAVRNHVIRGVTAKAAWISSIQKSALIVHL